MRIIGKYLIKNIFAKPFRTILLVVCITCCSFVAMLSLDITGNIEKLVKSMLMQATGSADMIVSDSVGVEEAYELPYESDQLPVFSTQGGWIDRSAFYAYFHRTEYSIDTMDYETAYRMRLITVPLSLREGEAAVSEKLAKEAGWSEGDTVTLYDAENQALAYQVTVIVPNQGMANNANILFLDREDFGKLGTGFRANTVYIDVRNDGDAAAVADLIEKTDFNAEVTVFIEKDEFKEMIRGISILFLMVFAVCFLLVIFVAISVSGRIVCERFSVVGTFRSLGISAACCTGLLIAENVLYGLLGSLAGIALYLPLRTAIWGSVVTVESQGFEVKTEIPGMDPMAVVLVLLLCVLIMCACPLKEIISTSKTAIRDIIFDNKDTAYRMHKAAIAIGVLCAVGAAVTFCLKGSSMAQICCFVQMIAGIALLFPVFLKVIAGGIGRLFEKWDMPVAHLAARECYARKSTVGSAGLCVTASTLALVIFILTATLGSLYDIDAYDCDLIVQAGAMQEASRFSYIRELPGVTDTEVILNRETEVRINGEKYTLTVFGLNEGGFRMLSAIKDCPESLAPDSFVIDRVFAGRMGLREGDRVEITFDADSYMPATKTLTLASFAETYEYDTTGNVMVLPKDLYQDMYQAYPGQILVRCNDPEETLAQIEKYSAATASDVKTAQEQKMMWQEKKSSMRGMLSMVIIAGVGLTLIGMISNQLIGFQGRRRECAVLASTSLTRGKLSLMFLLESMFASGIALLIALPAALTAFIPFRRLLESYGTSAQIVYDGKSYLLFLGVLWAVYTLAALFPIRELGKMNLAVQLKYE